MNFNYPSIVGTNLYHNHQFWPTVTTAKYAEILTDSLLPDIRRPEFTLEQLLAIVFRVKEWTFSGQWGGTYTTSPGVVVFTRTVATTPTVGGTANLAYPSSTYPDEFDREKIEEEPRLASEFLSTWFHTPRVYQTDWWPRALNSGIASPYPFGDALKMREQFTQTGGAGLVFDTEDYRAGMNLLRDLSYGAGYRGIDTVIDESGSFYPYFAFSDSEVITLISIGMPLNSDPAQTDFFTIDPVVVPPIQVQLKIDKGLYSDFAPSAVTMAMTASKFFEYRNSLNQPVYDEATGAQINDPFA